MRRRIAIAIFLTVAATLVVCGGVVYWAARSVLLADLDRSLMHRAAARPELVDSSGEHSEADHPLEPGDRYVIRAEADGRTIHSSQRGLGSSGPAQVELVGDGEFVNLADGRMVRSIRVRGFARPAPGQRPVQVVIAFSGSPDRYFAMLRRLTWVLILGGAIGCGIAAVLARALAGAALRPLRATADAIGAIDESTLHHRIEHAHLPPELQPVALKLNQMLQTLDEAMQRRKQFMADAAHELRTPVAAMMTGLELALRRPRESAEYRAALENCLADARHLRRLVKALLTQARGDVAAEAHPVESFDPAGVLNECIDIVMPLAEQKQVAIHRKLEGGLSIQTSPDRLRAVLVNLLGNAIDHNPAGGAVTATLRADGSDLLISIADRGSGIAARHLAHIFEPFYRADGSRRADDHLGLGLFLVRTHCQQMGADCTVQSTPGSGTDFTVRLPGVNKPPTPEPTRTMPATLVAGAPSHAFLMVFLVCCITVCGVGRSTMSLLS